ncbi:MAG: methionine--tRNA ligase [Clostridium sp.]
MNVIIGNAWPYANGPLHLGRIAVLLPGDILARYHRLMGDDVVFVSGSDSHGTPVTIKAKEDGVTPLEACEKYHDDIKRCFDKLGFSFDIFAKTHTEYHEKKVQQFVKELYEKGYIYEKEISQAFCEKCNEFLLDRYIEGNCPHCGGTALGDQCEECSEIFEADELLNKRCKICKSEPIVKNTKHLFFALSKVENDVRRIFIRQSGWRENAQVITKRYLDEGLRDRAVTRDFNWGVDVPFDGFEDKRIYVWIEALMGYLTASIKILEERGEDFMEYWDGEDSRVYFVHGKDNIPFHTVIFPGILAGLGIKNPRLRVISSEYLKLEGKPFSAAKNWAIWGDYIANNYSEDAIRYYLTLNSPEKRDSDFTWREFINTNNGDLVGILGNFINRVLLFINRNFNGRIPSAELSKEVKNNIFKLYFEVGDKIEEGKFKESLEDIMKAVKKSNKYFDENEPWVLINKDKKQCEKVIYQCVQMIVNYSNLLYPFMPRACEQIRSFLDLDEPTWSLEELKSGKIKEVKVLFDKIDKKKIIEESKKVKENSNN